MAGYKYIMLLPHPAMTCAIALVLFGLALFVYVLWRRG